MKLLLYDITYYDDEELFIRWGVLFSDFNTSKLAVIYYVTFLIRRFILAASFIFLRDYPLVQVLVSGLSCAMVIYNQILVYVAKVRPYKNRLHNITNILNESAITLGYLLYVLFLVDWGIDEEVTTWMIIGCIGGTYLVHNLLITYNVLLMLIRKIKERCAARRRTEFTEKNRSIKIITN